MTPSLKMNIHHFFHINAEKIFFQHKFIEFIGLIGEKEHQAYTPS